MKPLVSPRELAEAIGVSESSLKRWADDGRLEFSRTAGGHRRIAIGEAIRFVRSIQAPVVRPELLGLPDLTAGAARAVTAENGTASLYQALEQGSVKEVRGMILSWYLSGQSISEIADGPIRTAMQRLGNLWHDDPEGIYIEHRAVDICVQAVQQLRPFAESLDSEWIALGGTPSGDPYVLPSILAATALSEHGWHTINLGADTPWHSFVDAARRHRPHLVWISVSHMSHPQTVQRDLHTTAHTLHELGSTTIVGGHASTQLQLQAEPWLRQGHSIGDLVAHAQEVRSLAQATTQS